MVLSLLWYLNRDGKLFPMTMMKSVFQDLAFAYRQLRKRPGFALTCVLILALGIGASTAIFSALSPVLIEPLPYPHANRIVMVWYAGNDGARLNQTFHTFRELMARNRSFDTAAVMKPWLASLAGDYEPEPLDAEKVSADYFRVLGIAPAIGRDFVAGDDLPNGPRLVILSNRLWQRRFAGDSGIIGRQVRLEDANYTVIGVMPAGFEDVLAPSAELWSPLQYSPGNIASSDTREWGHHLRLIARLRPGVTIHQARRNLYEIANTPVPEFPRPAWAALEHGFLLSVLQDDITRGIKPALFAVTGGVILVLIIACVNVTSLLLARAAHRCGEFAVRAALGASQARLMRQLLTETLLMAAFAVGLGIAVARVGVRVLVALSPAELPRLQQLGIHATALLFALVLTTVVGLLVGVVPALYATRRELLPAMQQASQRSAGGHQVTRQVLVVTEVAVAIVLLVGAGLLLQSVRRLFATPPGFDASHLLSMQVQTYGYAFHDDRRIHQFFERALDAVRQVPGVSAAALTSQLPFSGDFDQYGAYFENDPPDNACPVFRYSVTPDYFATMHIPLIRGRLLQEQDRSGGPLVILVSESLARSKFAGENPIGKRVRIGPADSPFYVIVGVVGNVKQLSLSLGELDAVYTTTTQWHRADGNLSLVLRSSLEPAPLVSAVKRAIWSVDKDEPITRVATVQDLLITSEAQRRFVLVLLEAFALVALVLAATGLYGVLSGSVAERLRELGVRTALGASRGDIVALILRQGAKMAGLGIVIGLVAAMFSSRLLIALLFGTSRLDLATYFAVIMLLACVSIIACAVPAWRAAQIDPAIALRAE